MEAFPWQTFSVATAGWTLVAVFVWMLLNGKIVPRQVHDDLLRDRDQWREESRIKDQQLNEQSEQLKQLAEVGETAKALLIALSKATSQEASA